MKAAILIPSVLSLAFSVCLGGEILKLENLKLKNGREYKKVTITEKQADGIRIAHQDGAGRIPYEDIPDSLAKRLGMTKDGAEEAREEKKRLADVADEKAKEERERQAAWAAEYAQKRQAAREAEEERAREAEEAVRVQAEENERKARAQPSQSAAFTPRSNPRIQNPSQDRDAEIRELDAKILAIRRQMTDVTAIAMGALDGTPSGENLYKVKTTQLDLLQAALNALLEMRNEITPRQNAAGQIRIAGQGSGYFTTIEKEDEGVLILGNKAAVAISSTYIGFIGWNKKCLMFREGNDLKIWIEGKKTFNCKLLRAPEDARTVGITTVTINEVFRDGKLLKLEDGRVLKVDDFDTFETKFIRGPTAGLLLENGELVLLDEGGIVSVEVITE